MYDLAEVCHSALGVWVLEEDSAGIPIGEVDLGYVPNQHLKTQRNGSCSHHGQGLWVNLVREVDFTPLVLSVDEGNGGLVKVYVGGIMRW